MSETGILKDVELPLERDARILLKEAVLLGELEIGLSSKDHLTMYTRPHDYIAVLEWEGCWRTYCELRRVWFVSEAHGTQAGALEEMLETLRSENAGDGEDRC